MKLIVFLVVFSVSFSLACINCRRRKNCEAGWTQINRTLGGWCVKLVTMPDYLNYSQATSMCNDLGAVLSSIESQEEFEIEIGLMDNSTIRVFETILGSQLTPECNCFTSEDVDYCPITTECTFTTAYEWTDNFTVGTSIIAAEEDPRQLLIPGLLPYLTIYEDKIGASSDDGLQEAVSIVGGNVLIGALCGKKPS